MSQQQELEEGPRDFGRFLAMIADGAAASEVSRELQRIVGIVREEAETRDEKVSGSLTLKIYVDVDPAGHADIGYDVTVKEPKKRRHATLFFVTKGDNLSDQMTKQEKLPLREAPPPRQRDADEGAPSKTVAQEV